MIKITEPHLIPLSLYIHFPWCIKKCPYCDFNSHTLKETLPEAAYVEMLCQDLLQTMPWINQRTIQTIFMGGGTPSLFSAQALSPLFNTLQKHCHLSSDIEITLEANPSTVEQARFKDYRHLGINRISLGIQSFQDSYLQRLGRVHNGNDAEKAITAVQQAGFEQFNLDLMFGLPDQTLEDALHDLNKAISYAPPHLSWYELTLEPNTPFAHNPPALPSDDFMADIQTEGQSVLQKTGLKQYEVSAYTTAHPCRHNINYWEFGDYIAIGAGGHGKITLNSNEILRYQQIKHPKQYMLKNKTVNTTQQNNPNTSIPIKQPSIQNKKTKISNKINVRPVDPINDFINAFTDEFHYLTESALPFEYFLNTLRLCNGAPTDYFTQRTGLPLSTVQPLLDQLVQKQWLAPITERIKTTPLGFRFLNNVHGAFLNKQ